MSHHKVSILMVVMVLMLGFGSYFVGRTATTDHAPEVERAYGTAQRDDAAARAAFESMVPVLRHPRCMNCHSSGDFPRQGDDGHAHAMDVRRGPEGRGVTAQKCNTCHQDHNLAGAHLPPGAPNWGLPPPTTPMIWQGLSDAQICRSIKDPKQNKNRNIHQLVEHLTEDKLVMWGWNPGEGRNPIPMPHDEFAAKVKEWAAKGAACPVIGEHRRFESIA